MLSLYDKINNPCLFVVAVAGLVFRLARAHPIGGVAQASAGAVLGLLGARDGFVDGNARRRSRRGVGQLSDAGDEQRQVAEVLEELDRPRVSGGRARLPLVRDRGKTKTKA